MSMSTLIDKSKLQAPPLAYQVDDHVPVVTGTRGNDRLGLCQSATHADVMKADASAQSLDIDFSDAEVLKMYEVVGGYVPGNPATDNGGSMQDAANYARRTGLVDLTGVRRFLGPWMQVDYSDITQIMIALHEMGSLPIGVALPHLAANQAIWDTDGSDGIAGSASDQRPDSWGGHSLTLVEFDHDGGWFRTWGERKQFTWRWFQRYVDEAIAKIDPLWCADQKLAPSGFDLTDLIAAEGAFV